MTDSDRDSTDSIDEPAPVTYSYDNRMNWPACVCLSILFIACAFMFHSCASNLTAIDAAMQPPASSK
jgi:hypothetical protein